MRYITLFALGCLVKLSQGAEVCRALALSGGGSVGSYEAGVIYGLNHHQDPTEVAWDVISGVSAGAINAFAISLWRPDQGREMSHWLVNQWSSLTTKSIYTDWPEGIFKAVF